MGLGEILLKGASDIQHGDPRLAVRLGLRAVQGVVEGEFRETKDRLARDRLVEECRALLLGYLTDDVGEGGSEASVEFFDVWG